MKSSLSLVVPVYNEEENLPGLISEIQRYFSSFDSGFEVIFVDDGSSDSSASIIGETGSEMHLLRHDTNRGYGEALKTGFEYASNDLIAYIDGDGQLDIDDLDKLLEEIDANDLVIGERTDRKDSADRIVFSKGFNFIIRKIAGFSFRDIDCGLKLFRREVLEEVDLLTSRTVDAELVAKAYQKGFDIRQVEVNHYRRKGGESEAETLVGVRPGLVATTLREIKQIRCELENEE